ncbi:TraB/GumN family protein [Sphingosinicella sp.]|uniref:TraB/GumN family protein n=1 Tax=Sphingosinicella sp. TaxID=1917971 RepID=UPI004037BA52
MKKLIRMLGVAALACSLPANAQLRRAPPAPAPAAETPLPDADPALWVVRDADTTIYLFGTFHMLDGRPWFDDEVRAAFEASSELVLEATQPEEQGAIAQMVARYAMDTQGRPLSQRLPPEENERLNRALADVNLSILAAAPVDPWYASISITVAAVQRAGLLGANGAEGVLSTAARARGMPIGQLESFEWQMQLLDGIPEDLQLFQLRATLRELSRLQEILGPALAAWSRGDVERLAAVLDDPTNDDPRLRRIFLSERNATWARWIRERMARPGTLFIAVGAGHLAGRDSVQALLAEAGIRAERVPHVETP